MLTRVAEEIPMTAPEHRAFTAAGGGTALTTTAVLIAVATAGKLIGKGVLSLIGRNLSTAVVVKYLLNPRLTVLVTSNKLSTLVDATDAAQDGSTSTDVVLSSLAAAPNGYIYVGSPLPIRGVRADVDAPNGTASVMTGEYWNGSAWAALTITDGTASGGATMAVDGDVTWTVPAAWAPTRLIEALTENVAKPQTEARRKLFDRALFWCRFTTTGGCDSATTLNSLMALNRVTTYNELVSGEPVEEDVRTDEEGGIGCIEALTDAGTANLEGRLGGNFAS